MITRTHNGQRMEHEIYQEARPSPFANTMIMASELHLLVLNSMSTKQMETFSGALLVLKTVASI